MHMHLQEGGGGAANENTKTCPTHAPSLTNLTNLYAADISRTRCIGNITPACCDWVLLVTAASCMEPLIPTQAVTCLLKFSASVCAWRPTIHPIPNQVVMCMSVCYVSPMPSIAPLFSVCISVDWRSRTRLNVCLIW